MEEAKIEYYSEIDIQHIIDQGDDVMQAILNLQATIESIISKAPDNLSEKQTRWINDDLSKLWIIIINLEHQSRSITREIECLNQHILCLIPKMHFNSNLILSIVEIFEFIPKNLKIFEFETFEHERSDHLMKFDGSESFLSKTRPQSSGIITKLINDLFITRFISASLHFIQSTSYDFETLHPILSLITQIEPFISETYISLIIPFYMQASIEILRENSLPNSSIKVADFLTTFSLCNPSLLDSILNLFCHISKNENPTIQYSFIGCIKKILQTAGPGNLGEEIKTTLISISTDLTTSHKILKEIFDILPILSKFISFSDDNLCDIIRKSHNFIQDRYLCISNIIEQSELNTFDKFGEIILTGNIFDPHLYITLFDRVESKEMMKRLFYTLLSDSKRLSKYDLSNVKMSEEFQRQLQLVLKQEDHLEYFKSISYLIIHIPKVPFYIQFVMKIINESTQHPDILPILSLFGKKGMESKALITNFFNFVFKNFLVKGIMTDSSIYLIRLLTEWINNFESLTCDTIIENLARVEYIHCHSSIFPLASVIMQKTKNESIIINLLFKIIFDTVPQQHSYWLMTHFFKYSHHKPDLIKQCVELLINLLYDPIKKNNAVSLIFEGAIYESDFFRLDDIDFGFRQSFSMDNKLFYISFHPFNSVRRIYHHISHQMSLPIEQLSLTTMKGNRELVLSQNMPLTSIQIDPFDAIRINKTVLPAVDSQPETPCTFLELLRNQNNIGHLFQSLDDEFLFRVMLLLLPLNDLQLPAPINPIQELFFNKCRNPIEFIESRHIFPFALKIFVDNGCKLELEDVERIFNKLIDKQYDPVSLAMICSSLVKLDCSFSFSSDTIKHCLIECNNEIVRKAFLSLLTDQIESEKIVELIKFTLLTQNRSKTKEFFVLVGLLNLNKEIFVPYFEDLEQFEFSHYSEVDETYISLLDLIPANEKTIKLTMNRLFSPPTCRNVNMPFVHTIESWRASLLFLLTNRSIDYIKDLLTSLPETPNLIMKLTNDFTFKGRNGLINLGSTCYVNSLLQILNSFPNISLQLICKQNEGFSPFVDRLKEIMAELKFVRGSSLSIRELVDTIPNFNCEQQEDAEEFLNRVVNELNDHGCPEIASTIQGKLQSTTQTANKVIASETEDFYFLSIPTKGLSQLDQALKKYFEDSPIEGGYTLEDTGEKVDALKQIRIIKWPQYLCLQLQRWDFNYDTQERTKLNHKFEFPIQLDTQTFHETSENLRYCLKGVIIHQGTAEEGHYFAIVKHDKSNDWYVCNDQSIDYFEISELPKWAFGLSDDSLAKIGTGYLLFYEMDGTNQYEGQLTDELETKLNSQTSQNWPNVIFYSEQFVLYIMDFLLFSELNVDMLKLALTVLFKIAVVDEKILDTCNLILNRFVFVHDDLRIYFFDFIDKELGKQLATTASLSDSLSKLIMSAFEKITDSTYPLKILLNNLNFIANRRIMTLVLTLIAFACKNYKVNWVEEDECLLLIIKYLTIEYPRDSLKMMIKQHTTVMNTVLSLLYEISLKMGVTDSMAYLFDLTILNRIYPIVKKSDPFEKLLMKVNLVRPDFFYDIGNAPNQVKQLLDPILSVDDASNDSESIELSTGFLWESFPYYIFNKDPNIRKEITSLALQLLGPVDDGIVKFFEDSFIHDITPNMFSSNEPSNKPQSNKDLIFPDPSAIPLYFIGLIPKAYNIMLADHNVSTCDYFLDILIQVSRMHPSSTALYFRYIAVAFFTTRDIRILQSIHDLLIYDYSLIDNFSDEDIDDLLSSNCAAKECANLLFLFKQKSSNSVMSGSCVQYYLSNTFDQGADLLIKMIQNGFVPGDFDIPEKAENVLKLKLANALWEVLPEKREGLSQYMLSAISTARPFQLLSQSATVKVSCELLKDYCPDLLESTVNTIVL